MGRPTNVLFSLAQFYPIFLDFSLADHGTGYRVAITIFTYLHIHEVITWLIQGMVQKILLANKVRLQKIIYSPANCDIKNLASKSDGTHLCVCVLQDKATWTVQQKAVRKQLEQQYDEKMKLEDGILQKMHDQLTIDKAAKYTFKLVKNLRQKTKATVSIIYI